MNEFLRFAVLGLGFGALYALAAQGVVLIYRGSGVINFAQGAMGMVGAFVYFELHYEPVALGGGLAEERWPFWPALAAGVATSALLGLLTYVLVMRPLRHASPLARLVATLGVLTILTSLAATGPEIGGLFDWGATPIALPSFYPFDVYDLGGGVTIAAGAVIVLAVTVGLTAVLWLVYRFTRFGIATTAVAENERAASSLGWSPDLIAGANWAFGAGLAGLAGVLVIPFFGGITVYQLTSLVVAALAAALVGRFTSFPVTLLAGLFIGILQSTLAHYVTEVDGLTGAAAGISQSAPFLVIIGYLVVRGTALPVRGFVFDRLPALGAGRIRPGVVAGVAAAAVLLIALLSQQWVDAIGTTLIFGVVLLSIVVVSGFCGQLSLGQWALAGVGAFIAARLVATTGVPLELAVVIAVLGTIPVGLAFALPAVRTRGVNLAIVTLGLGLAVQNIVFSNSEWNGGLGGTIMGRQELFGISIDRVEHPETYALVCLVCFVVAALVVANVRRGRVGRRLIAVRTNERAAAALGVNVVGAKLYAFGLASALAALGGILYAFRSRSADFATWSFGTDSIVLVGLAVIGGIGFTIGSVFGATLAVGAVGAAIASEFLSDVEDYITLIGGVVLIAILLSDPDGLASQNTALGHRLLAFVRRGVAKPIAAAPEPAGEAARRVEPRALHVDDLSVHFGGVVALDGLTLDVVPGKVLGLIGPNGAGKTTAIDAITGFVRPAAGDVQLDGRSLRRLPVYQRARAGVSRSFQSLELFEDLTVLENLRAASDERDWLAGLTGLVWPADPPLHSAAVAAIEEFGLADDLHHKVIELSFGRRRLVGIARAVATLPSVLLLDEPAAGLGDSESRELAALVRRLADEWGIAVLLVEHDMSFVMGVCDELVVLDFGRVIGRGTPADVRADPVVVAAYLGEPEQVAEVAQPPPVSPVRS
jgi:ABC-type branched-subunit amino acid transport system ATPase component/branched-subunit amino acid ABC-type transport system permease component